MSLGGMTRFALTIALSALASGGCAAVADTDPLTQVWSDPLTHDGQVFDVVAYPFDVGAASFVMCLQPCSGRQVDDEVVVLRTVEGARLRGATGLAPYPMRVRFLADCFKPGAVCGHVLYIFEEVPTAPPTASWSLEADIAALSQIGLDARSAAAVRGNLGYAQRTAEYRQLQEAISGREGFKLKKVYYEVGINRYQSFYTAWGFEDGRCLQLQVFWKDALEQKSCVAVPGEIIEMPWEEGGFGYDDTIVVEVTFDDEQARWEIGINPAHLICRQQPCAEEPLPPALR